MFARSLLPRTRIVSSCPMTTPRFPLSLALLIIASFCPGVPARAELTWKQKTVQIKADPSMGVVEARFAFTNTGAKAVEVQQVESSCGCTTAELEQRHYEPGKGGEIVARYTLGNHVGLQRKTIAVKTNDQSEPTILTLVTDIPEMIRIKPPFVTWSKGDAKTPKTMILETTDELSLESIELHTSNPAMHAELEPVVKGHKYQITVTPGTTDNFVFATFNIDCRFSKDLARTFHSYGTVKPISRSE